MQKRKSHMKSRNGCLNCKKRHVKCDERGPPCANCIVRESTDTCRYVGPHRPPPDTDANSSSSSSSNTVLSKSSPRPSAEIVSGSDSRRLLELELMHQWSTSTYKSLCSSDLDNDVMQIQIPQWCLENEYLLNGLFSIAALEISMREAGREDAKSAFYAQLAMEYYDRGSTSFRKELGDINEGNSTALYMFSSMAWIISMAIPHDRNRHYHEKGILERISTLMDLIMGSSLIAVANIKAIFTGPLAKSIRFVITSFLEVEEPNTLSADDVDAFARLKFLSDQVPPLASINSITYENAVLQLRVLWREDLKANVRGIAIAFPSLATADFAIAVNESQPMALLILMHWAIMLDKLDRIDDFWWARSVGQDLVVEISERLLQSTGDAVMIPEFWESVAWAREKVGLPPFTTMQLQF